MAGRRKKFLTFSKRIILPVSHASHERR